MAEAIAPSNADAPAETKTRSAVCSLSFMVSEHAYISNPIKDIIKYNLNLGYIMNNTVGFMQR